MFRWREPFAGEQQTAGGNAAGSDGVALSISQSLDALAPTDTENRLSDKLAGRLTAMRETLGAMDLVGDLGADIGSLRWFRSLATLMGLSVGALTFLPAFSPLSAASNAYLDEAQADEYRSQTIMPLAFGGDTGRRMSATDAVVPLAASPERPSIELVATLGQGDSFSRLLQRAGLGGGDADRVVNLLSEVMPTSDIEPGTRFDITLGRRASQKEARPLDLLKFRARFDLNVEVARVDGGLSLIEKPIRIDETPLRIRGTVGSSLYRSARAAGAPASVIQNYLRTLGDKMSIGRDIRSSDEYDMIVEYRRAETGEVEIGKLLYAGLNRGEKPEAQLVRWNSGGREEFFEASGVGETRGEMARPVSGAISSNYGMRRHPILGYKRMHAGTDFRASYGTPIHAATDGVVVYSGRHGGHGKYVKINHGSGLASGYAHMSRIAVSNGTRVRRGEVIGYVGSTGLSTGPHLHYELYRNGRTINPMSVKFTTRATLSGSELNRFKEQMASLLEVEPGAALTSLAPAKREDDTPKREIDRLNAPGE